MPTVDEAISAGKSQLASVNKAGVDAISSNQEVEFTPYVRLVLPLDGYVFWVRADLLSQSALVNSSPLNRFYPNQPRIAAVPAAPFTIQGSLHYAIDNRQEEAETYAANRVVFTAESKIDDLNEDNPNLLYIGMFEGLRFAFSARGIFYKQAGLWHYSGFAVFPDMERQLVDSVAGFDTRNVIVSNSLPIWLSMNYYENVAWQPFNRPSFTLYPSYLVPANITMAWGAIHIPPESTTAIANAPNFGPTWTHNQLVTEKVQVTLWGTRNFNAIDFVDFVGQLSLNPVYGFGIMNQPVVRDEKRIQSEINAIAMKKTVEFQINYNQTRVNDLARKLIKKVIPTYIFN